MHGFRIHLGFVRRRDESASETVEKGHLDMLAREVSKIAHILEQSEKGMHAMDKILNNSRRGNGENSGGTCSKRKRKKGRKNDQLDKESNDKDDVYSESGKT